MKKERLLIQKSALEKMLKNIKGIDIRYYQGLGDYAGDLFMTEKLDFPEYTAIIKLIMGWREECDYGFGNSLSHNKAWLLGELIKVDKKLRRKEKINNFFGAIKGLFALNKLLKKWNFNTW